MASRAGLLSCTTLRERPSGDHFFLHRAEHNHSRLIRWSGHPRSHPKPRDAAQAAPWLKVAERPLTNGPPCPRCPFADLWWQRVLQQEIERHTDCLVGGSNPSDLGAAAGGEHKIGGARSHRNGKLLGANLVRYAHRENRRFRVSVVQNFRRTQPHRRMKRVGINREDLPL